MPATDARFQPSVALRLLAVAIAGCLAVVGSCAIAPLAQGAAVANGQRPTCHLSITAGGAAAQGTAGLPIALHTYPYFQVRALGSTGQTLGVSSAVATPAHVSVVGNEVFVPRHGTAAVPVSCFPISACQVTMSVATTTTPARTGTQLIRAVGGLAYFKLSPAGHALVAQASRHRLPVAITVRGSSGNTATRGVNPRSLQHLGPLSAAPDWRKHDGRCGSSVPLSSVQRMVGRSPRVVSPGQPVQPDDDDHRRRAGDRPLRAESLGANAIGYLRLRLNAAGHSMLARSRGDQLSARVDIIAAGKTASAAIVLSTFR